MIQPDFNIVFWGKGGKKEVFDSDVHFPEHFFQDRRIEKEKITYNKQIKCNWSKHTHTHTYILVKAIYILSMSR